jgi:uncharacterized protein YqgC (DUF456 family)
MYWVWASLFVLVGLAGPILTVIGLSGAWLVVALLFLGRLIDPPLFSWWIIGFGVALALLGELLEFLSSAAAVRVGRGSRRGMTGAVVGGLIGGIIGAGFGFIIGALLGSMIGAAAGTLLAERSTGQTWSLSARSGGAAAAGRLAGTIAKLITACIQYVMFAVAAFVP